MSTEPEPKPSRWKPIAIALGAFVVLAAVTAVGIAMSGSKTQEEDPGPTSVDTLDVFIDMRDYKYIPKDISVPSGAIVTWYNYDNQPHTATESDSEAWDTEVLGRDEYRQLQFDGPARYTYYCTLHPYMRGVLTVRAPGEDPSPAPTASP